MYVKKIRPSGKREAQTNRSAELEDRIARPRRSLCERSAQIECNREAGRFS